MDTLMDSDQKWIVILFSKPYAKTLKKIMKKIKLSFYKISLFHTLLNNGAKRNRLLYLKIMYTAIRKILHLQ